MDDFRVIYFSKDDTNHLLNSLKNHYATSTDWEGRNNLGFTIDWNYSEEYVEISMTDYLRKVMDRIQHPKPKRPQYAPHRWSVPAYGKRPQMATDQYKCNIFDKNSNKKIHSIVINMLYYARLVDPTILRSINELLRVQSRPAQDTAEKAKNATRLCCNVPK